MQDRYAGDIGDFGKIGLLQELCNEGFHIGINWYKTVPDQQELKKQDGRIPIPEKYSCCNRQLYETLCNIKNSKRSIKELENADLISNAVYYSDQVPVVGRTTWHKKALDVLSDVDLVFLDPDNGLLAKSVTKGSAQSVKYVFYEEVEDYLNYKRSVLIYSHRSRKKPKEYFDEIYGALSNIITKDKKTIYAISFPKGSVRDYFAISTNADHCERIRRAFETLAYGNWGDMEMCRLQPLPFQQCPHCGNHKLKPVLYGMPSHTAFEREEKGYIVLGGCCIEENAPKWMCSKCKRMF